MEKVTYKNREKYALIAHISWANFITKKKKKMNVTFLNLNKIVT